MIVTRYFQAIGRVQGVMFRQTLMRAAELCETGGNVGDAGFAYLWLAWCHQYKGDFDRSLALKEQVLAKIRERFDLVVYVRMLCCSSPTYAMLGRWDEALKKPETH